MYMDVILSDNSNDSSFRPVRVTQPFQSAMSRGQRILVHCTAVTIRLSVTIFTECAANISLRLADTCHT